MSRKPPARPAGAPPPDLSNLSKPTAPSSIKKPPGPPGGVPPSKRGNASEGPKKPPPSMPPPSDAKARGSKAQDPRPPPKRPPPTKAPDAAAQNKPPPKGKAPPAAKDGGRVPPSGPPPGGPKGAKSGPPSGKPPPGRGPPPGPPPPAEPKAPSSQLAPSASVSKGAPPPRGAPRGPPPRGPGGGPPPRGPPRGPPGGPPPDPNAAYTPAGAPQGRAPPRGPPPRGPPRGPPGRGPPPRGPPPGGPGSEQQQQQLAQYPPPGRGPPGRGPPGRPPPQAPSAPPPPEEAPPESEEDEMLAPPPGAPPPPAGAPPLSLINKGNDGGMMIKHQNSLAGIKSGRLCVKCIQGHNIRKKGQAVGRTKVDAFVAIQLGKQKKAPKAKTSTQKKANEQPNFHNEMLKFDVLDVFAFANDNGSVSCHVELIDEAGKANTVIGTCEIDALPMMKRPNKPYREKFVLLGADGTDAYGSTLELELTYMEARVGVALLTLYEGRNLKNREVLGKQDPYVTFSVGEKYKKQSQVITDGGVNPYFKEERFNLWIDRKNWVHDLSVHCWDEDEGTDDLIGSTKMSLLEMMAVTKPDEVKEGLVEIFNDAGTKSHGHLLIRPQFLPAGILKVKVLEGKGLRPVDGGRQDPYIVLSIDGQAAAIKKKTKVVTDGGSDLVWDETLELDIVDQYDLNIECYDHDLLAEDSLIGKCTVSLLPVFKKGEIDTWITLRINQDGSSTSSGDIHLIFTFDAPYGIKYPQNQPGIDSFDEQLRLQYLREQPKKDDSNQGQGENALTLEGDPIEGPRDTTFADEEIEAAFRFVDLDKNGYIGANELRHCLICMGEMITDEEVDMMITMVDGDGDGQVSYTEFYSLVTDPDPGRPDFGKSGVSSQHKDMKRNAEDAARRAKEAESKEEKRKMLSAFVEENSIGGAELAYAVDKALEIPLTERQEGIDFKTFCQLNQVDPTGEYLAMFNLFDLDETGMIDFKTITLGMLNFVDLPKEDRCDFVFRIFDEDASGLLSMDELLAVLAANHMQSRDAVKRKAETIMKTVDKDGNGELSMDEFRTVGQKFPNILFPAFNKNSDDAPPQS